MKLLIATASDNRWNRDLRAEFESIARLDRHGVHQLTDDAKKADVILFVDSHQHLSDWTQHTVRSHILAKQNPGRILVYDERDLARGILPGLYVSLEKARFEVTRHRAHSYFSLKNDTRLIQAQRTDLLFSFQGARTSPIREGILQLSHPRCLIEDTSHLDFFNMSETEVASSKARYRETLARSKFILCPRGAGTSSFRLFEVMACGKVPVIISDGWVAPKDIDWDALSLRVPEANIPQIPQLLEENEHRFERMSVLSRETYNEWFSAEAWFHHAVEWCNEILVQGEASISLAPLFDPVVIRDGLRQLKGNLLNLRPGKR